MADLAVTQPTHASPETSTISFTINIRHWTGVCPSEDSSGAENLVATLMAIPDYTEQTPDKPVVHFEERRSGSTEAIHSWFYPGENTGWEFVYPNHHPPEAD